MYEMAKVSMCFRMFLFGYREWALSCNNKTLSFITRDHF